MSVYAVRLEFLLRNTSKYQLLLSGSGTALSYRAAWNSSYQCRNPFLCRTMEQTIGICLLPSFGCDNYCSSLSANSFRVTSAGGAPWWDGVTHSIRPYYTPNVVSFPLCNSQWFVYGNSSHWQFSVSPLLYGSHGHRTTLWVTNPYCWPYAGILIACRTPGRIAQVYAVSSAWFSYGFLLHWEAQG